MEYFPLFILLENEGKLRKGKFHPEMDVREGRCEGVSTLISDHTIPVVQILPLNQLPPQVQGMLCIFT